MRPFAVRVFISAFWTVSSAHFASVNLMTSLLTELSGIYNTKCVEVLVHDNPTNQEYHLYRELLRSLSATQITKQYDMKTYDREKNAENDLSVTKCFRPIRVTIGNERSREPFEKVSRWRGNMESKPVSVVFLNTTIEDFFFNVSLPYNLIIMGVRMPSKNLLEVYEVFRVDVDFPIHFHRVGNWSLQTGIRINPRTVFSRRYNFEGKVLRAGSIEKWPLSTFSGYLDKTQPWDGYYCAVWNELGRLLNFRTVYYEDDHIGLLGPDGQWSGLISRLLKKEIDVIVADVKLTQPRLSVLAFTYPLISSWYQIYYRRPGYRLQWYAIFQPFNTRVWMAIVAWTAAGALCFHAGYRLSLTHGLERGNPISLLESFFFMVRTLSNKDYNTVPSTFSCRTIFLMAYVIATVLIPAYSASLISFLTQHSPVRPFDSLEGLLRDGTYKLMLETKTSEYFYFARATDKTLKEIYKKMVQPIPIMHFGNFSSYGLEMLCRHKKMALFDVLQTVKMKDTNALNCELLSLTQPLTKVDEGIAFAKGNPFAIYIHHHVNRMTEAGLIRRIQKRVSPSSIKTRSPLNPVKLEEVFQIFLLLLVGMVASVAILVAENVLVPTESRGRRVHHRRHR